MRDLVRWLAEMECTAGSLYADAAGHFCADEELSGFLRGLEQDEIYHYDLMNRITDMLGEDLQRFRLAIFLDRKTRERLEAPLIAFRGHLSLGSLTREEFFDCLVSLEFSEWNDIFIYVVESLKDFSMDFQRSAAKVEDHMRKISRFIERRPGLGECLQRIREIGSVWSRRVLIIDDEPGLVKLLKSFLGRRHEVECARDGNEALRRIGSRYYDIIISNLHLRGRSGMEVFREALRADSTIKRRYLFMAGDLSPEYKPFFEQNDLPCLCKPFSLAEIDDRIRGILYP